MGFQPRIKSRRNINHEFTKPLREKGKNKARRDGREGKSKKEQTIIPSAVEISDGTLRRLHTLGSQKFGSSPFSDHFNRWLMNVKAVLSEFESNPNIKIDEQFDQERSQVLSLVKQQLENICSIETFLGQEARNLADSKRNLEQIKMDYLTTAKEVEVKRAREISRLTKNMRHLKNEQDQVIRTKTGIFRGISRKTVEKKEAEITQKLTAEQREFELATLNFKAIKQKIRDEYERRSRPVFNEITSFQKKLDDGETDISLEDRWFACEALIDAVNSLLQRNSALSSS